MKKEGKNKFIWVIVIILILIIGFVFYKQITKEQVLPSPGADVARTFSRADAYNDEIITVTLNIALDSILDKVYSIEETLPSGTEVVGGGSGTLVGDKLRWLEYQPPLSTQLTYTVRFANPGTYDFAGNYMFNDEALSDVSGETQVVVTSCEPSEEVCGNGDEDCDHEIDEGDVCGECSSYEECGVNGKNAQCQSHTCSCIVDYTNVGDVDANCCVSTGEVSNYVTNWLNEVGGITQEEATGAANNWVNGISACP